MNKIYQFKVYMKSSDANAIKQMNTGKHLYLKVTGKGEAQHLTVCKRGFCGRLWMWLGFGSSSMKKIARYIEKNQGHFKQAESAELASLKEKLGRYTAHHRHPKICKVALHILSQAKPVEKPEGPKLQEVAKEPEVSLKPSPVDFPAFRKITETKFKNSLPQDIEGLKGSELQASEQSRLKTYLQKGQEKQFDLIYFSTGWIGGKEDFNASLFPGFLLESLVQQKAINTIHLEIPEEKDGLDSFGELNLCLRRSGKFKEKPSIGSYDISRFRSGAIDGKADDALLNALEGYFAKALKSGATVVIGDHGNLLADSSKLIEVYNRLRAAHEGRIKYMRLDCGQNMLTQGAIDSGKYEESKAAEWTCYPNLLECTFDKPESLLTKKEQAIESFNRKFITSAPSRNKNAITMNAQRRVNKEIGTLLLDKEIAKFNAFMGQEKAGTHDVVYVCLGPGGETSQVWPGFVFQQLEKGKKIKTLIFEELHCKFEPHAFSFFDSFQKAYSEEAGELPFLDALEERYEVRQFLCGYPDHEKAVDTSELSIYTLIANLYWPTKKQVDDARALFETYLRRELEAGSTLVLGEHRGGMSLEMMTLYNQLLKEFPGKVKLVWAWGGCNLMTSEPLSGGDLNPTKREKPWTYYDNLRNCLI